jgi:hypothetical protein
VAALASLCIYMWERREGASCDTFSSFSEKTIPLLHTPPQTVPYPYTHHHIKITNEAG